MTIQFRRMGIGEFAGKDEVCDFTQTQARAAGVDTPSEITAAMASNLIERWNMQGDGCWVYTLVFSHDQPSQTYEEQGTW